MSSPPRVTDPRAGAYGPASRRNSVDWPERIPPITATGSPAATSSDLTSTPAFEPA
jgi:hypothetical protein